MSTRLDILAAKGQFEDHISEHKCRIGQCGERKALWLAYQDTAARWGQEPTDAARNREAYAWQDRILADSAARVAEREAASQRRQAAA